MPAVGAPLSDWLQWLETLSPKEIDLGLDRVRQVLERLSLPLPDDVLLIAGTNGKGSCTVIADALLRAAGKRVGRYTSPHISRYNERIVVNGATVDDAAIIAAFGQVDAARGDLPLTYFEFGTLAALVVFAQADLDVWLLEVGLGGRLDATNAVEPTASLITNISLDHCDWLGDDIESIAAEKAGVMRPAKPTVFGSDALPDAIAARADACGAILLSAGEDYAVERDAAGGGWRWRGPSRMLAPLVRPGLRGDFQIDNAAAVLMLLEAAGLAGGLDVDLVNRVLPDVALAGRLQRLSEPGAEWLLDVAHNPAAARKLAETIAATTADDAASNAAGGEMTAIVGILDDKDVDGILAPLLPCVSRWVAMRADSRRAVAAGELARRIANLSGSGCLVAESTAAAVEFARRRTSENDRILVTGSFFTVAPVIDYLAAGPRTWT